MYDFERWGFEYDPRMTNQLIELRGAPSSNSILPPHWTDIMDENAPLSTDSLMIYRLRTENLQIYRM